MTRTPLYLVLAVALGAPEAEARVTTVIARAREALRRARATGVMVGFMPMLTAERLTRWQCRSRSGVTPSNARAPSKTSVPCQAP